MGVGVMVVSAQAIVLIIKMVNSKSRGFFIFIYYLWVAKT